MKQALLDELFAKITEVTKIKDIAYHKIMDGKLNAVHKTMTIFLDIETWKKEHAKNPVYIENTPILKELLKNLKPIAIDDTKKDSRSADEFFFFGIKSILIIPVVINDVIQGIIVAASIEKHH